MSSLFSAGSNARGQLSNGTQDDSHIFQRCTFTGYGDRMPGGSKCIAVAAGANHTLVHLQSPDGTSQLWGCGDNRRGQLGASMPPLSTVFSRIHIDDIEERYGQGQIKLIEAGWETSFIVIAFDEGDMLFSAGGNDFGDLGVGSTQKEAMTWEPVPFRTNLPEDASEVRISGLRAGPHTIIVRMKYVTGGSQDQLMMGWGACRHGQLGPIGPSASQKLPNFIASPFVINAHGSFIDTTIGNHHSTHLLSDGTVLPFGSNRNGQIGGLESARDIVAVQATWNGVYLLQEHNINDTQVRDGWSVLKSTGRNIPGAISTSASGSASLQEIRFPIDAKKSKVVDLVCGSEHVLVHLSATAGSVLYGWGWNEHGNLGLGHTDNVEEPTKLWTREELKVGRLTGVWAGCATSWIAVEREDETGSCTLL